MCAQCRGSCRTIVCMLTRSSLSVQPCWAEYQSRSKTLMAAERTLAVLRCVALSLFSSSQGCVGSDAAHQRRADTDISGD